MGHAYLIMEIPKPQYLTNRFPLQLWSCRYCISRTQPLPSFESASSLHSRFDKSYSEISAGRRQALIVPRSAIKSIHVSEEDQHGDEPLDIMSSHCVLCDRSFGSEDPLEQHLQDSLIHQQGSGNPFGCLLPLLPNVSL
jgi:hypothetical protein